jgi:hypothetical protein
VGLFKFVPILLTLVVKYVNPWMIPMKTRVIPKGFKISKEPFGNTWIEYRPAEVSGPARFFIIWTVFVSIACIGSTYEFYSQFNSMASFVSHLMGISFLGWFVLGIVVILMMVLPAVALFWFLIGKSSFELSSSGLSIQKSLLFWHRTRFVPREEMLRFTQVIDGGSDDDSFLTWGLVLNAKQDVNVQRKQHTALSSWSGMSDNLEYLSVADPSVDKNDLPGTTLSRLISEQEINLIARESIDKSDWLGMVLSEWYHLRFVPSRERE